MDDSTLDKLYAKKMELVTRHWSGKHGRVVQGINLITLLWTLCDRHIPRLLSVLREKRGRNNQERPLPCDADDGAGTGICAPVRGV